MSENTNKNLVGQSILTQVLALVNKITFRGLVRDFKSDRYYKKFTTWTYFVNLMFVANIEAEGTGILSVSEEAITTSFNSHVMIASVSAITLPQKKQLK